MSSNLARQQAAYQFELQSHKLYLAVQKRLAPFRYLVRDDTSGATLQAVVLASSFDFYELRLHRATQIDLIIVQKHNAVLPTRLLDMATETEYPPGACPVPVRSNAKRPSHAESLLLISKLILGLESANAELAAMHIRTRQRYIQRRDAYLMPKLGRPYAN